MFVCICMYVYMHTCECEFSMCVLSMCMCVYCFVCVCVCIERKARKCASYSFAELLLITNCSRSAFPGGIVDVVRIVLNGNWRFEQATTTGLFRRSQCLVYSGNK